MDEIFKYLIVAAFIVYAVVKQARAGGKKDAGEPGPQESVPPGPLPENWGGDAAGGGWFDVLKPQQPAHEPRPRKQKTASRPVHAGPASQSPSSGRTTAGAPQPVPPPQAENGLPANGIDVRSAEEVRRGFIWSVILERKYD